ncbi:glycosyltransferase family 39 protein [Streptomyces albireticuli]|uniref:glycosyltransferase family 39 protein n=1 Tax=Streptomyces albireticuli TaxID=1940 RepID=UPI001F1B1A23|nr:glycosyltransferase family 39 protein [Streptomyces albireticuli]
MPSPDRTAVWAPAVVALALGLWGITGPSAWTDEVVTMDVAQRSGSQLMELLGNLDAVHGLHYVLMHLVGQAVGVGEFTMRVPSAVAVAVAAGGLAWLGRMLGGPRLGLYAGLLLAVMPTASRYAQEARSFAFVMAVAVLATGALVKALSGGRRWAAGYAVLIALLGWFNAMGLLLVAAHMVTVVLRRPGRRVVVRLLSAQAAGIAAVAPLLVLGFSQRSAVGDVAPVAGGTPYNYLTWLLTPGQDTLPAALKLLLTPTALAAVALLVARRHKAPPLVLAVGAPWLTVPPLVLMAASLGQPLFAYRYLLFCLPALALLIAAAATVAPLPKRLLLGLLLAVPMAVSHLAVRQQDSRPWDTTAVITTLDARAAPGDGVLFSGARCDLIASAAPETFAHHPDLGTAETAAERGTLDSLPAGPALLDRRLAAASRVWHITCRHLSPGARRAGARTAASQEEALARAGLSPAHHRGARGLEITLYRR